MSAFSRKGDKRRILRAFVLSFAMMFITVFAVRPASAEDWREQDRGHWVNYDSAWVDSDTGVIVLEVSDDKGNKNYVYGLIAIDCSAWRVHQLTPLKKERSYGVYATWRTSDRLRAPIGSNSFAADTANYFCPKRDGLPRGNLPR